MVISLPEMVKPGPSRIHNTGPSGLETGAIGVFGRHLRAVRQSHSESENTISRQVLNWHLAHTFCQRRFRDDGPHVDNGAVATVRRASPRSELGCGSETPPDPAEELGIVKKCSSMQPAIRWWCPAPVRGRQSWSRRVSTC
jgi:hypothetical protein